MPPKRKAKAAPKPAAQQPSDDAAGGNVAASPPVDGTVTSRNQQLAAAVQEARSVILGCAALSDLCDAQPYQTVKNDQGTAEELRLQTSDRASYNEVECEQTLRLHKSYQSANNIFFIDAFSYPANYAALAKARVSALVDQTYKTIRHDHQHLHVLPHIRRQGAK